MQRAKKRNSATSSRSSHNQLALLPEPCSRLHIQALLCYFPFCTVHKVEARHLKLKSCLDMALVRNERPPRPKIGRPHRKWKSVHQLSGFSGQATRLPEMATTYPFTFLSWLIGCCHDLSSHRRDLPLQLTRNHFCDESTRS